MEFFALLASPVIGAGCLALFGARRWAPEANAAFSFATLAAAAALTARVISEGNITAGKLFADDILVAEGVSDGAARQQGRWKFFFEDGSLKSEGDFKDGKREGEWVFYYRDGKVQQRGGYKNDKPVGDWKWYYPSGNPLREESFTAGREDGTSREYNARYWPTHLNLGILEAEQGNASAALESFERVLELAREPSAIAEASYRIAEIYVAQGRREEAMGHLRAAVVKAPSDPWGKKSEAYLRQLR